MKTQFAVHGLAELDAALRELRQEMDGKEGNLVGSALMSAALPVLRDAQNRAPRNKEPRKGHQAGTLAKQIKRNKVKNPRAYSEIVNVGVLAPQWAGGKLINDSYGKFVELGTRKMAAQPFLRPALEANREESPKLFGRKLGAGIEREAKKIGSKNLAAVGAKAKRA